MARLSVGEAKFARLKMLKISARNCALKVSEIRFTRLFLKTEKSSLDRPGPITALRPRSPRRLAQVPAIGAPARKPNGWHCAAIAGVGCGSTKQAALR